MDKPYLYKIDLPQNPQSNASAQLVHAFTHCSSLLGITEYAPHTLAVITGNFSLRTLTELSPGNYPFWSVSFAHGPNPSIHKITDLPNDQFFLNGLTTLDAETGTLLFGDSLAGRVYSLRTRTGDYELVLEDATMKSDPGVIGINRLRTATLADGTYLYHDNSNITTVNRVQIDPVTARARGPYTTLASGYSVDDLAYDYKTGDVYVAENDDNVIVRVSRDGTERVIAGGLNSLFVAGPTSVVFGKGKHNRTLYATTTGGTKHPINGIITTGAKVVSLEVDAL